MKLKTALLISLGALGALAVYVHAMSSKPFAIDVFARATYYLVLALFLVWVDTLFEFLSKIGFSASGFVKRNAAPLGVSLVMTALIFSSVEPRWRVLSDETNLISVSQAMLFDRTVYNHTMNKRYYGSFTPLSSEVEKRPMVFPFLIHLVHLVRGYHAENAFVVNGLVLFGLFALVGVSVTSLLGSIPGAAAVLLVAAYPLITMQATSAGFDLISTFFTFLLLVLLYRFFKEPSGEAFRLLWVQSLVFANTRYESVGIAAIVLGSVFLFREFRSRYVTDRPLLFILTPFLILPIVIQRIIELVPSEAGSGTPVFSLEHFQRNLASLVSAQGDFGNVLPHPTLMNWLFVAVLFSVVIHGARGKVPPMSVALGRTVVVGALAVSAGLLMFLAFHGGSYAHPASARLFLTPSVVVSLGLVFAHAAAPRLMGQTGLLLASLAFFIYYHPVAIQSRFTSTLILVRETEVINDFLDKQNQKTLLMVAPRPGQIAARQIGSVSFAYANDHRDALLRELERRLFSDIFVAQRVGYDDLAPVLEDRLDSGFTLETLTELQTDAGHFMRISRVTRPAPASTGAASPASTRSD